MLCRFKSSMMLFLLPLMLTRKLSSLFFHNSHDTRGYMNMWEATIECFFLFSIHASASLAVSSFTLSCSCVSCYWNIDWIFNITKWMKIQMMIKKLYSLKDDTRVRNVNTNERIFQTTFLSLFFSSSNPRSRPIPSSLEYLTFFLLFFPTTYSRMLVNCNLFNKQHILKRRKQ